MIEPDSTKAAQVWFDDRIVWICTTVYYIIIPILYSHETLLLKISSSETHITNIRQKFMSFSSSNLIISSCRLAINQIETMYYKHTREMYGIVPELMNQYNHKKDCGSW